MAPPNVTSGHQYKKRENADLSPSFEVAALAEGSGTSANIWKSTARRAGPKLDGTLPADSEYQPCNVKKHADGSELKSSMSGIERNGATSVQQAMLARDLITPLWEGWNRGEFCSVHPQSG